jgi:nitrile hydratase subunit beta
VNGVHDLGGMHGFGPVVREDNEPVFHADWERRIFGLSLAAGFGGNLDQARHAIERMPPDRYLASTYYERWLYSLETRLIEKGLVTRAELEAAQPRLRDGAAVRDAPSRAERTGSDAEAAEPMANRGGGVADVSRRHSIQRPRFKVGSRVIARNINPEGHTRLPRYARGRCAVIRHDWGVFVFPDTNAHGRGPSPQHCYNVEFRGRELWGIDHPANERIFIDLWEAYLEPDLAALPDATAKIAAGKMPAPKRLSTATKKSSTHAKMRSASAKPKQKPPRTPVKSASARNRKTTVQPRKRR